MKRSKIDKELAMGIGGVVLFLIVLASLICFVPISVNSIYRIPNPTPNQLAVLEQGNSSYITFLGIKTDPMFLCISQLTIRIKTTALTSKYLDEYFRNVDIEHEFITNYW